MLEWFMSHQRPQGWRHWAEVVWRDPRTPRMIGDMPHTWCGSDFLNAARAMFVYEDRAEQRLVLFAGVPDEWFTDPAGVAFENLRTEFGSLSATATPDGPDRLRIQSQRSRPPARTSPCVAARQANPKCECRWQVHRGRTKQYPN